VIGFLRRRGNLSDDQLDLAWLVGPRFGRVRLMVRRGSTELTVEVLINRRIRHRVYQGLGIHRWRHRLLKFSAVGKPGSVNKDCEATFAFGVIRPDNLHLATFVREDSFHRGGRIIWSSMNFRRGPRATLGVPGPGSNAF
jgi:hypothetical protein